jgi:hypothetical protein
MWARKESKTMPYHEKKLPSGKYQVSGPSGVHAKGTTKQKAEAQMRLLPGVEHGMVPRKAVKKVHHSPTMTQVDCSKLLVQKRMDIMGKDPTPMGDVERFKIAKDKKVRE